MISSVNPGCRIEDFSLSQGDKLDISGVLSGFDKSSDSLSDFLQFIYNSSKGITALKIMDGGVFESAVELRGNHSGLDINALFDNGQIIVA